MERKNYYLHKDSKSGEILYLEYAKMNGYPVTPRASIQDAIRVNKIVLVNPGLSEKLIRKKVEIKLRYLLETLEKFDEDEEGGNEGEIRYTLMEAERLKLNILTKYVKYLGNTYGSFSIKKIQIIINQLRMKLYNVMNQRRIYEQFRNSFENNDLYYLDCDEPKKGRGR